MAPPVDDTRRYDLFLCAASSGTIAVASSASSRLSSIDAGDLANAVFDGIIKRARDSDRTPSVFYATRCVQGRHDESADAALQTRGGGVALSVITKPFLRDQSCIHQLLCFLSLQENALDGAEFDLRFVLVGVSREEFLQDLSVQPHAHHLAEYVLHVIPVQAISEVASRVIELGWDAWLSPSSPNVLGATVKDSLLDLLDRVFHGHEVSVAKLVFGIEDPNVTTLADVFSLALSTYKIGSGYDGFALLDKLVTAGSGLISAEKRAAIASYKRKWSLAGAWDWSSAARDRLKPMSASLLTPAASSVNPDQDAVKPPGFVQRNPIGVLLDYDNPATEEGRLKRALLRTDSAHDVVAAVAAQGMGGVGKTCTLRGLGRLQDVWRRFPGGIFFLELGQDVTVSDVLRMLSKAMRARGNDEYAKEITGCSDVKAAVDIVVTALSNVDCLFLIDDVWSITSCTGGHLTDLQHLVESNDQSRMVFSTRDKAIAEHFGAHEVSFGTRDAATSRRMLLKYAGFTEEEANSMSADAVESLQSSLSACGGLPIALAATGRLVENASKRLGEGMSKSEAWSVHKKSSAPYYALCAHGQHPGLSAALLQSVDEVDKRLHSDGQECKYSAAEMYRALCVLEKQSWAPFSMLCALWSVDTASGIVKRVAEAFEGLSMLEIVVRKVDESRVYGIRLHDLAHDFCTRQASSHRENVGLWDSRLLNGYLPLEQRPSAVLGWRRMLFERLALLRKASASQPRHWWSVPNDGYIYMHVIRHLLACNEFDEAAGLLLDFRYILAQVEHNELHFLTQDIDRAAACLREASGERSSEASGSKLAALELLGKTIRSSWGSIAGDARALPHRFAFQLLGRMNQCKTENTDVERLLRSVGEHGPAPFLRPLSLTLSMPRPDLRISLQMGGNVKAVAWIPKSNRVVAVTGGSKVLFVVDVSTGKTVHTLSGHNNFVTSVAAFWSSSAAVVASGGENGTVRLWSAETGREIGPYIQATEGSVVAAAASTDGAFIIFASSGGDVRRWKITTREEVGSLVASAPESLGVVQSVVISSSGRRVAAGTGKGEVWVWDLEGVGVGATVAGVKHRGSDRSVIEIAMTADGETVVSAGKYDSTIYFWSVRQQRADGDPIEVDSGDVWSLSVSDRGQIYCGLTNGNIHVYDVRSRRRVKLLRRVHTGYVNALEASADDRQLASGGEDGRLRLWDLAASSELVDVGERPGGTGRCTEVTCIAASADGLWVVTGHDRHNAWEMRFWDAATGEAGGSADIHNDCEVRFWDAATGEAVGSALCGHSSMVSSVAVSPDSRRVVSGSYDDTVRVWDVDSRAEVLGPLCASSGVVQCVAISADGSRIASGHSDGTLRVWAMATGADLFGPLCGHTRLVRSVAISHDDQWIASGSFGDDVRLWDMRTGAPAGEPLQCDPASHVCSVAFSADSQHVVSRDYWGGDALAWSITTRECIRIVKPSHRLYHSSVDDLAATGACSVPASSTLLSMSHSARSRCVYQGDPADENIVAVFDLEVEPDKWHFDSERQRLWVFYGGTVCISDFK